MIWVITSIILVVLALAFGAPFLDFLAPSDDIWLIDSTDSKNPILLAKGADTLWEQWQIWLYIGLFVLVLIALGSIISAVIQNYTDVEIDEKKKALQEEIDKYEDLQNHFKDQTHREVAEAMAKERKRIEDLHQKAVNTRYEANQINKETNFENNRTKRETQSKMAQRDRLSEQKKLLVKFLDESGWTFKDGSPITYSALLKLARYYEENKE